MIVHDRYHRQRILPDMGDQGQASIARAHVAIVGVGALGCASADLLARAGVGTLTLIDRDLVDWTNLQRQCLYSEQDARDETPKALAAQQRLQAVNRDIRVIAHVADATGANIESLLGLGAVCKANPPTILVDGLDNFTTRYLLNDVAVKHGLAYCHAGVVGTRATQATFVPVSTRLSGPTGCLRCLVPQPPPAGSTPSCDTMGVLGPVVQVVAGAQATDVLKIASTNAHRLSRSLLSFDIWMNQRSRVALPEPDPDCPCCAKGHYEFLASREHDTIAQLCGNDSVQVSPPSSAALDLDTLASRLANAGMVQRSPSMLRFHPATEPSLRLSIFPDGRVIIKGLADASRARAIAQRYVSA